MFYNKWMPKRVKICTKNREFVEAFLKKSRKSKIIDYADAVGLTGNVLCKEVSWEGVFTFCDYETEVIAV